ncbi:MAG: hypothetical protein LC776_20200 [Acidobacteria bacterium]|nr:hypothetical protein [Acidobacteriota bacterium]
MVGLTQAQVSKIEHSSRAETRLDVLIGWAKVLQLPSDMLWFDMPNQSRFTSNPGQASIGLHDSSPLSGLENMNPGSGMSDIRAMSYAFQAADRRIGGGRLYASVIRYIAGTIGPALLGPPAGASSAGGLFSAAASFTEFAGWMSHEAGNDERARTHLEQAYRLSVAADNDSLSANICASLSHLAVQLHEYNDSVRIAEAGLLRAQGTEGSGRLVARLHAMRARGLANQGNEHECMRSLV